MAEQPTILQGDKGTASRLALGTLSVLVGIQVALVAWDFLPKTLPEVAAKTQSPASSSSAKAAISPEPVGTPTNTTLPAALVSAPASSGLIASLPPPPGMLTPDSIPSGLSALPPPPGQLSTSQRMGTAPTPTYAVTSPPPVTRTAPVAPPPQVAPAPAPVSAPMAAPSIPSPAPQPVTQPTALTDSPEVNEIIATARETIALNDPTATRAALETLQRADLLLPDHPVVLREMALAHQKLNEGAKAQELFARANAAATRTPPSAPAGFGADSTLPINTSPPPPNAGPVSLGKCEVRRDFTCTTGERQVLRMELRAQAGAPVNPDNINIDVFFYDSVDNSRVEQSRCDKPTWKFDLPVDFKDGGVELVDVTYHMPRMNDAEVREHGKRAYHGFLAKLYYEGRLMGEHTEPADLRDHVTATPAGAGPAVQP